MRIRSGSLALALLAGTALVAPFAAAQPAPAPNAAPVLDRVVAGGITIRQDAATTQVTQTQQRGIVDWRGFDVGRDHTVQFRQPSASAATLNRVTGPDPSVIAGRITANGQVAIVNRSGVVFTQGAQVEAAGLIVSAAGITNENFLAGGPRLAFDQAANPGARVENAGTITIREAGLAGLVAPQVENNGTIAARMGRVALAGGEAAVVDLHGDGLVALEVTRPVTRAPGDGGPLVRNSGTIEATGGTVLLTAAAADGIVQDLVHAGGRLAADTDAASGRTGAVALRGTGGAIIIEGEASARGTASGTRGGAVTALAERVLVAGSGRVDASGAAGGGSVGIGAEGRRGTPRVAQRAGTAPGAVLRADATENGPGGTIRIDSLAYTAHAGSVSARGGPGGGDGGLIEVSGAQGLRFSGDADISAPAGRGGTVLLDPTTIDIVAAAGNVGPADIASGVLGIAAPPAVAQIDAALVNGFAGNLRLEAGSDITVSAAVNKPAGDLELASDGGQVTVNAPITLGGGDLRLEAVGLIQLNADVVASGTVRLLADAAVGTVAQLATAGLTAPRLEITAGQATLLGPNQVGVLANSPVDGLLDLRNVQALTVQGTVGSLANGAITLLADNGDLTIDGTAEAALGGTLTATNGNVVVTPPGQIQTNDDVLLRAGGDIAVDGLVNVQPGTLDLLADGSISLGATGTLAIDAANSMQLLAAWDGLASAVDPSRPGGVTLAGAISGGDVTVGAGTAGIVQTGGSISANALNVTASGAGAAFDRGGQTAGVPNAVTFVGPTTIPGDFVLDNGATGIMVAGSIQAANIGLRTAGTIDASQRVPVSLNAPGGRIGLRGGAVVAQDFASIAADTVELAPDQATPMVIGAVAGPGFLVQPLDLAVITANDTLRFGGTTFNGILSATAASVQFVTPLAVSNTLDVRSLGAVGQDPGSGLLAAMLAGSAGGATVLTDPGNVIGAIGDYASGGAFTLATPGALAITGHLDAPGQTVDLTAGGAISATPAGHITAGLLALDSTGAITLAGANTVAALGAVTTNGAGDIAFATTGPLTLTGLFTPGPAGVAHLNTGGVLDQTPGGAIIADVLGVTATGDVQLTAAPNTVFGLDASTAPNLALATGVDLRIEGPVNTGVATLSVNGILDQAPTGPLAVSLLEGSASDVALTVAPNAVQEIGTFSTPGGFALGNAGSGLTVRAGETLDALGPLALTHAGGPLTVDGTALGQSVTLMSDTSVAVNGFSGIARVGDLVLDAPVVTLNGLASAGGAIIVNAPALTRLGGSAVALPASGLIVTSPSVTFTGLSASGVPVFVNLGTTGTAAGAIDAAAFLVAGGSGTALTGSIAGDATGAAAALGRRANASGVLYGDPPPNAGLFTFNGCALATVICGGSPPGPSPTPGGSGRLPPTIADNPWPTLDSLEPAPFVLPRPESPAILVQLPRDPSEEEALAPADIRAEDY